MGVFLIILVMLGLAWFLFVLPTRRRQRAHEAMQDSLALGDEIITAGGMHGTIRDLGDEELRVEIAPGTVVTLDRRAVAAVARDVEEPADDEDASLERGGPDPAPEEPPAAR